MSFKNRQRARNKRSATNTFWFIQRSHLNTLLNHGCNENVLVTEERSPFEGSACQRKHYAAGVRTLVLWNSDINEEQLAELVKIRREVRRLDRGAHVFSDLYRLTEPVKPLEVES